MTQLGVDPDLVAAAVRGCPVVAGLSAGPDGRIRTVVVGRLVRGVRVTADAIEIHLVARYGPTVEQISSQVLTAVEPLADGREIRVHVVDLQLPGETVEDIVDDPPKVVDLDPSGCPLTRTVTRSQSEGRHDVVGHPIDRDRSDRERRRLVREFVRTHHPDVGGDPVAFVQGLAGLRRGLARPERTTPDVVTTAYRRHRGIRRLLQVAADAVARRRRPPRVE